MHIATYDIYRYNYKCKYLRNISAAIYFFNMLFIRSHFDPGSWTERGLSQFHPGLGYIDLYLPLGMDMADGLGKQDNPVRVVFFFLRRDVVILVLGSLRFELILIRGIMS